MGSGGNTMAQGNDGRQDWLRGDGQGQLWL